MILRGVYYPRPSEQFLEVAKVPVEATCPECGGGDVRRYPAFTARGPKIVHKCQGCFALVREEDPSLEEAHPPFWPMTRGWQCTRAG